MNKKLKEELIEARYAKHPGMGYHAVAEKGNDKWFIYDMDNEGEMFCNHNDDLQYVHEEVFKSNGYKIRRYEKEDG